MQHLTRRFSQLIHRGTAMRLLSARPTRDLALPRSRGLRRRRHSSPSAAEVFTSASQPRECTPTASAGTRGTDAARRGRANSAGCRRAEAVSVETDSIEEAVAAAGRAERGAASDEGSIQGEGSGLQYSMLRTPAAAYFPEELFEEFCAELAEFGQKNLGCDAFTPPWLACYTDGHEMAWHSDAPRSLRVRGLLNANGCHARRVKSRAGLKAGRPCYYGPKS